jgi:hypothetical protein
LVLLIETLLRIPFSVIGLCSLVPTSHWLQEINLSQVASGDFTEPQAAFCKCQKKIATLGSFKQVNGKIFKISK